MSQDKRAHEGFLRDEVAVSLNTGVPLQEVRGLRASALETYLTALSGVKLDGASMGARRADPGTVRERAYLASLGLTNARTRQKEDALVERLFTEQRDAD